MTKDNNKKKIRDKFNSESTEWRIEAVIHDGNWYDFEKWKKVSKVKDSELNSWIEKNREKLIVSEQNSYRVGYDEIIAWYQKEELDLESSIVPNNFPPKLWGKTTETDVFLSAPRRRVGTVSFSTHNKSLYLKCKEILKGVGKIIPDSDGRYKAHGLSSTHMKNLLMKGLTEEEFESIDLKTRSSIMQRELADLPEDWLEEALDFYANTFAPTILRSSMSTISIYLPDRHDIHSQTLVWVINAMKKFNEDASVPFSGYLSKVLRFWPYDLPDERLGKELARFQRERKRAIDEAISISGDKESGDKVSISVIAALMGMDLNDYIELNNQHENWLSEKNATSLMWEDSSNEKKGEMVGVEEKTEDDIKKLSKISIATVKAAVDSEDWDSAYRVISSIDQDDFNEHLREELSDKFLVEFKRHLMA